MAHRRKLLVLAALLGAAYAVATVAAARWLPEQLLAAPVPRRSAREVQACREALAGAEGRWEDTSFAGGEGLPLELHRLRRPGSRGVALYLHGFGDDAWGMVGWAAQLPGWDAACFTFRGRDRHPAVPSTLGAWECRDAVGAVRALEAQGVTRDRILLVGASQGAGVALLALADLEAEDGPLAGALLESPYRDLEDAARNHLRGTLGPWVLLARPAEALALRRAGRRARFDPAAVSPLKAAVDLRTPVALVTGDADTITPLGGVREIAAALPGHDLTVVPGAGHCEAAARMPGGWRAWADAHVRAWEAGTLSSSPPPRPAGSR